MIALLHTPTPDVPASAGFYTKLGFRRVPAEKMIYTDGRAWVEINPDRYARAGLRLIQPSWKAETDRLAGISTLIPIPGGHLTADPCGIWIYLVEGEPGFPYAIAPHSTGVPGQFAGLSLESMEPDRAGRFYEILGFEIRGGSPEAGYVTLERDDFSVSIMKPLACPHLFFNPSMTYFNGAGNRAVIAKIRSLGMTITEEITCFNPSREVDNIILRDPGGYGFFIFSD